MTIEDKINNIRAYLDKADSKIDKKIFASILDILKDICDELDELNESIHY
jgi:hypothetical protein